jgi:hypothetical protein
MTKFIGYFLLLFYIVIISCSSNTNIYVSEQGSDDGNGSLKKPFKTIEKAKDFIRNKRVNGDKLPYSILIRKGDYYFTETAQFTKADSNLTIMPYKDEKVSFTGGVSIDPANALPVMGIERENLFPAENRANILMVNLKKLGITDFGELHPTGFGHPKPPVWMEIFVNDVPGNLARWPNDSSIPIGEVLNIGSLPSKGDDRNIGGKFIYNVDRPSKWKNTDDIWIFGFFYNGWADDAVKLASIDTIAKTFTTAQPHRYGFRNIKPYNKWYAYNIAEEIDTLGEYYIDRKEGILYFYNPGEVETIKVSVFKKPFISINGSSNITFKNITLGCTRGIAAEMFNSENCVFQNCTFKNIGIYAVNINYDENSENINAPVASKNNGLKDCTVAQTGSGGIMLYGGNRNTLESSGNYVENCFIHDFNRISKTYCAGIKISGVGNRISHNEIYNSPHAAILLKGNDHLFEYNNIHDVCKATDDVGAFYYGRNPSERGNVVKYNYFHHIGTAGLRSSAIYHDDGACALTVFGNVLYKAGAFPTLIGGGCDNIYINNIFIDDTIGIKVDNRFQAFEWAKPHIAKGGVIDQKLNEIHYNQPPYSTKYPELVNYWNEDPAFPKRNLIDRNVFVRVDKLILKVDEGVNSDKDFLDFTENNYITDENPGFEDIENQNFKLKSTSEIFTKVPGFEQIPFEKIGPIKSEK